MIDDDDDDDDNDDDDDDDDDFYLISSYITVLSACVTVCLTNPASSRHLLL